MNDLDRSDQFLVRTARNDFGAAVDLGGKPERFVESLTPARTAPARNPVRPHPGSLSDRGSPPRLLRYLQYYCATYCATYNTTALPTISQAKGPSGGVDFRRTVAYLQQLF
jgi:hypothetical protein